LHLSLGVFIHVVRNVRRHVGVAEVGVVVVEEFNELDGSRLLRNSRRARAGADG
jgi:hypothetical protein